MQHKKGKKILDCMEQGWLNDENDLNRSQTKNVKINKLYFVRCKKTVRVVPLKD